MKNKQTHSTKTSTHKTTKKLTHITVRHIADNGQYIPVMNYDARNGEGGATLHPHTIPPDR